MATNPPESAEFEVFTVGYQLRSMEDLVEELLSAGVDVLVDVRETPWSRRSEYSKTRLSDALSQSGIEYFHARFAGNPRKIRKESSSHDEVLDRYAAYLQGQPEILEQLTELVTERQARGQHLCFFCYERHPHDCHRAILLSEWLSVTGIQAEVRHLGMEGAPRLAAAQIDLVELGT